ncbi:putative E3 ubiquitin ligase complex SCF subunit sconB [Apostichopus japonicus]|uniref:Putative E3 ubiquitin ligase complex SCF subunit sconB n=1 Tax=Stichopus japonicus TaxID=307972 RepID=A0A2G8JBY9_STIJA|nr:putative E3 ubiquitin ligase complex SCF subunit sconB [Apostichopus japonicus]
MYAAQLEFPSYRFLPISSHVSRETKARRAVRNYHHVSSAYLKNRLDVMECNRKVIPASSSELPSVTRKRSKAEKSLLSQSLPATILTGQVKCRSAPEASRRHKRPIRRHMDDYVCSEHQVSAKGDAPYEYHPVTEDDFPKLVKSTSEIQLTRARPTLSGTSVRNLPPISPLPTNAWQLLHWYSNCWNDVERNEFLHKLLKKFDARQLYYVSCILALTQLKTGKTLISFSRSTLPENLRFLFHVTMVDLELAVISQRACDGLMIAKGTWKGKFGYQAIEDYLSLLPEHLALRILSFLTPVDLLTCAKVSRMWNILSSHNKIWRVKCQLVKIDIPVPASPTSWKKIYKENVFLKSNWREGNFKVIDLRGHTAKVHCVAFDGQSRLASGSKDNTVRLWDIKSGQLIHTFRGHTKFFSFYLNTEFLQCLCGWLIHSFRGHTNYRVADDHKQRRVVLPLQLREARCCFLTERVWSVKFFTNHLLVSGSYDNTIKVWNSRSGACTRTLLGHEGCVWDLALKRHYLASASQDRSVKIWDLDSCTLMHTLAGHAQAVFCVDMDKEATTVISGSADRSVRIWNLHSGQQMKVIWVSQSTSVMAISYDRGTSPAPVEAVGLKIDHAKIPDKPRGLLVTAGEEGLVKYWKLHSKHSHQTLKASHGSQVNSIYFDETKIVSACADFRIRIWNFHTP